MNLYNLYSLNYCHLIKFIASVSVYFTLLDLLVFILLY